MADSSLRRRKDNGQPETGQEVTTEPDETAKEDVPGLSLLDGFRVAAGILLLNFLLSYFVTGDSFFWGQKLWWARPHVLKQRFLTGPVVLTDSELIQYDGRDASRPIYLALNGTIYDVTAARMTYGPGGPYHHFAGRDAARAFVTGCFKDDADPDLRGAEWTYVPKDVPRFADTPDADLSAERRAYRDEMVRLALAQVDDTIGGWAKVFRGQTGKDYWEVGYVDRKPGYLAARPLRPLCEPAEKQRPKAKFKKTDAGRSYRGGT